VTNLLLVAVARAVWLCMLVLVVLAVDYSLFAISWRCAVFVPETDVVVF